MIPDDKENFASRWSRRKIEARKTAEKPAEAQPRRRRTRPRRASCPQSNPSKASLPNTPNS